MKIDMTEPDRADMDRLHAQRAVEMDIQQIVDDLAPAALGATPGHVAAKLRAALAQAGVLGMPTPWVEAVAGGLTQGNAYVVSAYTQAHQDIPAPKNPVASVTIE